MSNVLRISVHFLYPEPSFHGKRDGGEPEWPPSPLRLFQALVDAAASRWREGQFREYAEPALEWVQRLTPSEIVTPSHAIGTPFRISVPNNDLNSTASYWVRGVEPEKPHRPIDLRTMKTLQPVRVRPGVGEQPVVHYLFQLPEGCPHLNVLQAAASSVTHVGWGIDVVAVDVEVISREKASLLAGHRWRRTESGGVSLRVPAPQSENRIGTLRDLIRRHRELLTRLPEDGYIQTDRLSCFDVVRYHSPTAGGGELPARPVAAFEIHRTIDDQEQNPGKSRFRPFHHVRKVATVAGMVRHAAADAARRLGLADDWVNSHVQGHGDEKDGQATSDERLMFLPLPSITPNGVSGIRRVLVVGWPGFDLAPLRRVLNGAELIDRETGHPEAVLSQVATTDKEVRKFTELAEVWSTVTPVILPGFDDTAGLRRKLKERDGKGADEQKHLLERLDTRIVSLLWKAFHQAGWSADALVGAELEYRTVGWFRGLDVAKSYELSKVNFPRYHVRVRFRRPVRGPLAVGAGRYRGLGLFAAE